MRAEETSRLGLILLVFFRTEEGARDGPAGTTYDSTHWACNHGARSCAGAATHAGACLGLRPSREITQRFRASQRPPSSARPVRTTSAWARRR